MTSGLQNERVVKTFSYNPTTEDETYKQQKAAWRLINGLQRQTDACRNFTYSFSGAEAKRWETCFSQIDDAYKQLSLLTGYKKKPREPFCLNLETTVKSFDEDLKWLRNFEMHPSDNSEENIQKIDGFKTTFDVKKEEFEKLFKNAYNEFVRLEDKIELYDKYTIPKVKAQDSVILRTRKDVADTTITGGIKTSQDNDIERIKRYSSLRKILKESLLKFNDVESLAQRLKFSFKIFPKLWNELSELKTLEETTNKYTAVYEAMETKNFHQDFDETSTEVRNLEPYKTTILECQKNFAKLNKEEEKLEVKNNNKIEFNALIKQTLKEISEKITLMEKDDNPEFKSLMDNEFKLALQKQREEALNELKKLRDAIGEKNNTYFKTLYTLNSEVSTFQKLINILAQVTNSYIEASKIRETVRDMRKTVKPRKEQDSKFNLQKAEYKSLELGLTCRDESFYSIKKQVNSDQKSMDFMSGLHNFVVEYKMFENQSLQSIVENLEQICNIALTDTAENAKSIGLLWTRDQKDSVIEDFGKQIESLKIKQAAKKQALKDSYEILKNMCKILTTEMNFVNKTLAINTDKYDEDFPKAYPVKNSLMQGAQNTISYYIQGVTYKDYEELKALTL